jgi:hypothetical protein
VPKPTPGFPHGILLNRINKAIRTKGASRIGNVARIEVRLGEVEEG